MTIVSTFVFRQLKDADGAAMSQYKAALPAATT
jgi:hypothetical protein